MPARKFKDGEISELESGVTYVFDDDGNCLGRESVVISFGEYSIEFIPRYCEYSGKVCAWQQYKEPKDRFEDWTPMVLSTKVIKPSGKISKRMKKKLVKRVLSYYGE